MESLCFSAWLLSYISGIVLVVALFVVFLEFLFHYLLTWLLLSWHGILPIIHYIQCEITLKTATLVITNPEICLLNGREKIAAVATSTKTTMATTASTTTATAVTTTCHTGTRTTITVSAAASSCTTGLNRQLTFCHLQLCSNAYWTWKSLLCAWKQTEFGAGFQPRKDCVLQSDLLLILIHKILTRKLCQL